MIALNLPSALEKHFREVVRESYDGNLQAAIAAFLKLHNKYGWKEQLQQDVQRPCVRKSVEEGGSKQKRLTPQYSNIDKV